MKTRQKQYQQILPVTLVLIIGLVLTLTGIMRSGAATPATPEKTAASPAKPRATFVGSETCAQCHEEVQTQLSKHFHGQAMADAEKKGKGYLCEGCHGAGSIHAGDPSTETAVPLKITARNGKGCLSCHALQLSPAKWHRSEHQREGVGCIDCHTSPATAPADQNTSQKDALTVVQNKHGAIQPHGDICKSPPTDTCLTCHGEKLAEFSLPSHHPVQEGRIGCADCHNPHQPMGEEMHKKVCLTCHAEQKGPFRFEHGAIFRESHRCVPGLPSSTWFTQPKSIEVNE